MVGTLGWTDEELAILGEVGEEWAEILERGPNEEELRRYQARLDVLMLEAELHGE
ncbi:MAG: hypothetical protein ACOCXY_03015 [Planctomycetota bacterium]